MVFQRARLFSPLVFLLLVCSACVRSAPILSDGLPSPAASFPTLIVASSTATLPATPSFRLQPTRIPGSPILTPTADAAQFLPTAITGPQTYQVQGGDTLGLIAQRYGVSLEYLMDANGITDPNTISTGLVLIIPRSTALATGSSFKIIPDSELVNGPMSIMLDVNQYITGMAGYLENYSEDVDGELLTGAEIITRVAQNYSVNPRLLLAVLEYRSGWLTDPTPELSTLDEPLGYRDGWHFGLYRQLTWAADRLNLGYYLWRSGGEAEWYLADGTIVPMHADINAGTAGVQALFAGLDDARSWEKDVSENGLFATFYSLFGYPFDLGIEPIVPGDLVQPVMQLPFDRGVSWAFTGGPHGGWDDGSAWAALDFAPAGTEGCVKRDEWVVAVADGLIVRSDHGVVVQDLDRDGYEQTGWTILYLHIASDERVRAGAYLLSGEKIGHPSCEGGVAYATHLHIARRFNGEWIPADGTVPFKLDGWISSGTGVAYDGFLIRGNERVEAYDGTIALNEIHR